MEKVVVTDEESVVEHAVHLEVIRFLTNEGDSQGQADSEGGGYVCVKPASNRR
jgi:hypothetical protein